MNLKPYCVSIRDSKGMITKFNIEATDHYDAKRRAEAQFQGKCVNVLSGKCH